MRESGRPQNGKSSPKAQDESASWKQHGPTILIGSAVALVLIVAVSVGVYFAYRAVGPASDDEKSVLKKLEFFDAKPTLDDKSRVTRIELHGPPVTDEALDEVAKLKFLKELSLAHSSVTDEGMAKLTALKRLESLGITDTAVSDRGLKHLEKMATLRHMWVVVNDRLTRQGVEALRRAVPGLTVHVMNDK